MLRQSRTPGGGVAVHSEYPHRLNVYTSPPSGEIPLENFEQWALDRVMLLAEISNVVQSPSKDKDEQIKTLMSKYMPLGSVGGRRFADHEKERRKDHYSHFILRLAFCRNQELRQKFTDLESRLFSVRYQAGDQTERKELLARMGVGVERATASEVLLLAKELRTLDVDTEGVIYKVCFTKVAHLVSQRLVLVRNGVAYVPQTYERTLVLNTFSSGLLQSMQDLARRVPLVDEVDRAIPVFKALEKSFDYVHTRMAAESEAEAPNSEIVSALGLSAHFKNNNLPMCMTAMHKHLGSTKHLKYDGRNQYQRFQRMIGMPIEQAIKFWREAFGAMTESQFKTHKYNIEHNYGMVGGRHRYCTTCKDIVDSPAPKTAEEVHGCPFKLYSQEKLTRALGDLDITSPQAVREINNLAQSQQYQLACSKVFQLTHEDAQLTEPVSSPAMYFKRAVHPAPS